MSDKDVEDVLKDMLDYSLSYVRIMNASPTGGGAERVLNRINKLEVYSAIPLILYILNAESEGKIAAVHTQKAFEIIENYIVRRIICGIGTTGLNKLFVTVAQDTEKYVRDHGASYIDAVTYSFLSRTGKSRWKTCLQPDPEPVAHA